MNRWEQSLKQLRRDLEQEQEQEQEQEREVTK